MVLDALAAEEGVTFESGRYGLVATVSFRGNTLTLLKPSTYMNLSGKAVRYYLQEKKIKLENLLVICDDLNLPFGTIRMRERGSNGGHNGLQNIIDLLSSEDWARIRMGIGNEFARGHQIDFVLEKFNPEQMEQLPELCKRAVEGIRNFVLIGPAKTMNTLNTRK